jgi:hypothetical protein
MTAAFRQLIGHRIPGGCDDCSAYQEVSRLDGIYIINICHDDTCPTWRQIRAHREETP